MSAASINGTAVLKAVLLDSPIAGIVGQRIFAKKLPAGTFTLGRADVPAITIDKISGVRATVHTEATGLFMERFQITCWGWNYDELVDLASVINLFLDSLQFTFQGVEILIRMLDDPPEALEPATGLYQIPLDARVALSAA